MVRCRIIKRDGERCKQWSLRGTDVCYAHGGRLPNVQQHAEAVVESARLRLIGLADMAVDQIEDLAQNASGEGIRLKAAQDILDRSGVRGAIEVDMQVTQTETAADRVKIKLDKLAKQLTQAATPAPEPDAEEDDDEIQDAEVVEDE